MIKEVLDVIDLLKKKPQLVLTGDVGFYPIKTFLTGYVEGMGTVLRMDMHKTISLWFKARVNQECSLFWTEHITYYYEGKAENEMALLFLETVELFFLENASLLDDGK